MPPYRELDEEDVEVEVYSSDGDSDDDDLEDMLEDVEESYSDDDDDDRNLRRLEDVLQFVDDYVASGAVDEGDAPDFRDVPYKDSDDVPPETRLLFAAAARNDVAQIRLFIEQMGGDVNARNPHMATPLCYAALHGHTEAVKLLVEHKAEPLAITELGATPLSLAAARGHTEVVEVLLKAAVSSDVTGPQVQHAFCEAAYKGHEAAVDAFLAAKVSPNGNAECDLNDTPLMRASKQGHIGIVMKLLAAGAEVDRFGKSGETALQLAAEHNHVEVADLLMDHGADVDKLARVLPNKEELSYITVHGGTALIRAAFRGHAEMVTRLLSRGADVTIKDDDGDTPLIAAVAEKDPAKQGADVLEIVKALLKAGADVNQTGHQNNTPLLVAAGCGLNDVVHFLLNEASASTDCTNDEDKYSPVMVAIEHCKPETVQLLIAKKASVSSRNIVGDTALHKAVEAHSEAIVGWLLEGGADPNAQNDQGDTPLIFATQMDQNASMQAVIRRLIDAGADVNLENKMGDTALTCAILGNAAKFACLLLKAGAKLDWMSDNGMTVFELICRKTAAEAAEVMQERLKEVPAKALEALMERALNYDLPDIVPMLVERANSLVDDQGNSVLMLAVQSDNVATVKHLLDQGAADLGARNEEGLTALQMATQLGHFGCFLALRGAGAELCGGVNEQLMVAALNQRWAEVEALMRAQNESARVESGEAPPPGTDGGSKRRHADANGLSEGESASKRSRTSLTSPEPRPRGPDAAAQAPAVTPEAGGSNSANAATPDLLVTAPRSKNPDAALSSLSWLAELCEMDPNELIAPSRSVASRILKLVRKRLSFSERLDMFRARLEDLGEELDEDSLDGSLDDEMEEFLPVHVSRGSVLLDAYAALKRVTPAQLRLPLSVTFAGEEGQDDGGLTREFFNELAREVTKPELAIFKEVPEGSGAFQPNPDAHVQEDVVADVPSFFRFIGRMVGKAISAFHVFNVKFTHSFLKQMLNGKLTLEDLESVDPVYYKGLIHVLNQEVEESGLRDETFTTEENFFGQNRVVELKPGGASVPVTDLNKEEYITLLARHRMTTSIKPYIDAFCSGLWDVIPVDMLQAFSPTELGEVISGFPEIDINDMQSHVKYEGFDATDQVIRWFWQIVREMPHEEMASLVQFITGSPKVPARGFQAIDPPITIKRGSPDRLPTAHTCINQLVLSEYKSRQALAAHLNEIIQHSTGFGFA